MIFLPDTVRCYLLLFGILGVRAQVQQTYERLEVKASAASVDDARFTFFVQSMWPRIRESATTQGILIFVRSYFDYVRLRNFLNKVRLVVRWEQRDGCLPLLSILMIQYSEVVQWSPL